jgi:GPI mannosyltransferase 4
MTGRANCVRPSCFFTILLSGLLWTFIAIATDTAFYRPEANDSYRALFRHIWSSPVITPLNNILYNTKTSNLAEHGLHPHYQHLLANLPQLLGPALIVLLAQCYPFSQRTITSVLLNPRLSSATTSILILSIIPHQEPRFLLPCVPLLLTCLRLPLSERLRTLFWSTWTIFNILLATLMGIYHQAGIIPAQLAMPQLVAHSINSTASPSTNVEVFWWKTYPPPTHLLGSHSPTHPTSHKPLNISTISLQGLPQQDLLFLLMQHVPTCDPSLIERLTPHSQSTDVLVAAPLSAWRLPDDVYPSVRDFSFQVEFERPDAKLGLRNLRTWRRHVNLDDVDFGDDGVVETLRRVVGRRGLGVWRVERVCD